MQHLDSARNDETVFLFQIRGLQVPKNKKKQESSRLTIFVTSGNGYVGIIPLHTYDSLNAITNQVVQLKAVTHALCTHREMASLTPTVLKQKLTMPASFTSSLTASETFSECMLQVLLSYGVDEIPTQSAATQPKKIVTQKVSTNNLASPSMSPLLDQDHQLFLSLHFTSYQRCER
jgi:hypothetical protein